MTKVVFEKDTLRTTVTLLEPALADEGMLTDELTKVTLGGLELAGTEKNAFTLLGDRTGDLRVGDKVVADVSPSNAPVPTLVTSHVKSVSYDATAKKTTVTLEDAELTADLSRAVFTRPPLIRIDTPDFGDLFDFSNISFSDILDGLIALSDFLGQFEQFGFLSQPLPLVNLSVNDLLTYADRFDAAVQDAKRNPAGTIQALEDKLNEAFGLEEGDPFTVDLLLETEDRGTPDTSDDHKMLRVNLKLGASFAESLGIDFDLGDAGFLTGAAELSASGDLSVGLDFGIDLTSTDMRGAPELTLNAAARTITRVAAGGQPAGSWVADGFKVGQSITIGAPDDAPSGNSGDYRIAEVTATVLTLEESLVEDETRADLTVIGSRSVSLFETTALSGTFLASANDINFRAAVGPLGLFVAEGSAAIEGDLGDSQVFRLGLDFEDDAAGRKLLRAVDLAEDFSAQLAGSITASLPVYFPTDSIAKGRVLFDASLSVGEDGSLVASDLGDSLRAVDLDGNPIDVADLFSLDGLPDLSLFDNVLLLVEGVDQFLGGLQDVLDGEVFGITLPLIGDSLSDGARFIEDLRADFIRPFRDLVEDTEDFAEDFSDPDKNILSELLFDTLVGTGLLLRTDANGNLVKATAEDREAGLFTLGEVIRFKASKPLNEVTPADLKNRDFEIAWDLTLGQAPTEVLGTTLDLDLGIPGLGFEAEGPLGLDLGWSLDFGFGLNFTDGFFLDIAPEDGLELEVTVEVTLPERISGQLAFLQLDALNTGSVLGATFAIDVVNKDNAADERLSFGELGKLRLNPLIAADAIARFDMLLKLNSDLVPQAGVFPTVGADFLLDWRLGDRSAGVFVPIDSETMNAVKEGLQVVKFEDIELDLGPFISDFVSPILEKIQTVTKPIQPIVDILTSPLPVLSDLGPPTTLIDLAGIFGKIDPALLYAIADIITLTNSIPTEAESIVIEFGDFVIYDRAAGTNTDLDLTDPDTNLKGRNKVASDFDFDDQLARRPASKSKDFTSKLSTTDGFAFPILTDPTQVFGLLTGQPVTLMTYDMPALDLELSYTQLIPLYPPLFLGITGDIAAHIDFAFGFDTTGIKGVRRHRVPQPGAHL